MIDPKVYAEALFQAVSEVAAKDHDKVLDNFVKILSQNGDLGKYDLIEAEYKKLEMASKGVREVEVTTASKQNPKQIVEELNQIIGGKAEIKHSIDERLIGGVVIRAGDTLIDASVKNSLEKLRKAIAQ